MSLRSRAHALLAADLFETVTLTGTRMHVLAVIEHATRRIRVPDATALPTATWVTQAVRNLAMDLHSWRRRGKTGDVPTLESARPPGNAETSRLSVGNSPSARRS